MPGPNRSRKSIEESGKVPTADSTVELRLDVAVDGTDQSGGPVEEFEFLNPVDELAEEFSERLRNGEQPSIDEFVNRCPEYEEEIRLIFPSIEAVEKVCEHEADQHQEQRASNRFFQAKLEEIADFEIIREIGRGGMGIVYEAMQKSLHRRVALKTVNPSISGSPKQLVRFQREAETVARLQHTNIIQIYGVGEADGIHFYAMQLVNGFSLAELIRDTQFEETRVSLPLEASRYVKHLGQGPKESSQAETNADAFPSCEKIDVDFDSYIRWVCQLVADVANALDYAHSSGVFHRDIKPGNLLVDADGTVLISDFGLAKFTDMDDVTQAGDLVGTLKYMAPEQFTGAFDARSDIFSLGLTLFELVALRPAFEGNKHSNSISLGGDQSGPPRLKNIDRRIPVDLETITEKAISQDPEHRFQSAGELRDELRRFISGNPIKSRPVAWYESAYRWAKRNPAIAFMTGLSVTLLITVALVGFIGNLQTRNALAERETEFERAEFQKNLAQDNLTIAKDAIRKLMANLSERGSFQQKSYRFENEEYVGTTARLSQADIDLLTILLDVFTRFSKANEDNLSLETAEAHSIVGDIFQKLGRYGDAVAAYQTAFAQYTSFDVKNSPQSDPLTPIRVLNELAFSAGLNGDRKTAESAFDTAKEYYEQHEDQLKDPSGKFEFARTLNIYASTDARIGPQTFVDSRPTLDFRSYLPGRRPRFGDNSGWNKHGKGGRFGPRASAERSGESPKTKTQTVERGKTDSGKESKAGPPFRFFRPGPYRRSFARNGQSGNARNTEPIDLQLVGQYVEASKSAEVILNQLVKSHPDNIQFQLALSRNFADRLRLIKNRRSSSEFRATLERARSILTDLIEENPESHVLKFELAETLMNNVFDASSRSKAQIREAVQLSKSLARSFPEIYEYRAQYADAMATEAAIDSRYPGKLGAAKTGFELALKIYKEITQVHPDAHQFHLSHVIHLNSYSDLLDRINEKEQSQEKRKEALAIIEKVGLAESVDSPAAKIKKKMELKLELPQSNSNQPELSLSKTSGKPKFQ